MQWRIRASPNTTVLTLVLALVSAISPVSATAANKWGVGTNTMFILEYALSLGVPCPSCPGNVQPRTLSQINTLLHDLAVNQHVGAFREIVPLELLSPNGTNDPTGVQMPVDSTNYAVIDAIMYLFKSYNLRLILAIGNPIPSWAAPWGHGYACFLPSTSDSTNFNTLKNNIGWTIGNYLNHLKSKGYAKWMAGIPNSPKSAGLFIEGFNEWNGNASYQNCGDFTAATPQRAATLESAIGRVANFYGVTINLAAPSVVFPSQGLAGWYTAYYAAGGVGAANIHIYGNGLSSSTDPKAAILYAQTQLKQLISALPAAYKTTVIWGETGYGEAGTLCDGVNSLPSDKWAQYDVAAAQLVTGADPVITPAVQLLTVWRLDQLANQSACEGSFGIVSSDLTAYLPPAVSLFTYLGGSGVMGKAP
jgi:hypothetical protein